MKFLKFEVGAKSVRKERYILIFKKVFSAILLNVTQLLNLHNALLNSSCIYLRYAKHLRDNYILNTIRRTGTRKSTNNFLLFSFCIKGNTILQVH